MIRPYIVTVYEGRKRTRFPALANDWHDAWLTAINQFGIRCVISVRPAR